MTRSRLIVAQLTCALFAFGCGDSHGRDDDAGLRDAGRRVDAGLDAGPWSHDAGPWEPDAGPRLGPCAAQDARAETCPELLCDGPPSWHWQGDRCFPIECGACVGADCERSWGSREGCEAAHASCEPQLCRSTGGDWRWWAEECAHFSCGFPAPVDCEVGRAVCDCGLGRGFEEGRGCVDMDCPTFPPPPDREMLCRSTGGRWEMTCCDSVCGELCADACVAPACNCGPLEIFDPFFGCLEATRCYERRAGEGCHDEARCEDGTICCDRCGGPGCAGEPRCVAPVCDGDETIDECGNRRDAP